MDQKRKVRKKAIKESLISAEDGQLVAAEGGYDNTVDTGMANKMDTTAAQMVTTVGPAAGQESGNSTQNVEEMILKYAKTSYAEWRLDPLANPELAQFSLFMLLNDGDSDVMANWDEVIKLISYVQPLMDEHGNVTQEPKERMKDAFQKNQDNQFLNFRQFQAFLKDIDIDKKAEEIDMFMYRMYFRKNCLLLCFGRCFSNLLRKVRMKQLANRLKKLVEIENKRTPSKPVDKFMFMISFGQVLGGFAQLFDFYSDIIVLSVIYYASHKEDEDIENGVIEKSESDYQLALVIIFLAIAATFMAQQSCIIGMKFAQGDFEPQNFKKTGFFSKIMNIMLLTFTGGLLVVPIEILDNLTKVFRLPGLILAGTRGVEKVNQFFTWSKQKFTGLNIYQLNSLEQQRKVTALLFENLPFTMLVFAIKVGFLNCPELTGKSSLMINISLASTLFQVSLTVLVTKMESSWLKEHTLSYLITKMTANNNWIPFIHMIAKRDCKININFGDLSIKIPFISHVFGFQALTLYEFSDSTLNYLLNELKIWSSEVREEGPRQKYRLTFTKDCLNEVSLNAFIHFVQNFPEDVFLLEIQLDWRDFYLKKELTNKIQFVYENGKKRTYSPIGVTLLQLCIQNETSSKSWPLRDMLTIILESGHYAIQPSQGESPLTVALQDSCFESLTQINNGDYKFDYQAQDDTGKSFLGQLIYKLQNLSEERGMEFDKLSNFTEFVFKDIYIDLNMHKKQFVNTGTMKKQVSAWQLIFKNLRHHRTIRFATKILIDFGTNKNDFKLEEWEKLTLFKNTVKLLMAHGGDCASAWRKLGQFVKLCDVDVFQIRDKNGNGLVHKLVKSWPLQIEKSNQFMSILRTIETPKMQEEHVNSQSLIYQQILDNDMLKIIFKGSIHTSEQILNIDSQNRDGQIIKELNTPDLRKMVIHHVAYSMLTLQRNFDKLMPQVKKRFNDANFEQLVKNYAVEYSNKFHSRSSDNQKKGDIFEYEGGKLTKRKPQNGNLKRKVCDELQEDLPIEKLSKEQIAMFGITEESAEMLRSQKLGGAMRSLLETILEWIAAADLYTDVLVFLQLLNTQHHGWTTVTIFSMLAPFFACQTPFLMFLKEKVYRDLNNRFKLKFMGFVMVSPIMLAYMFILDIIFVINQALLFPLICLIKFLTCGIIDLSCFNRALDKSYEFLFEMQKLEVAGFRRMRTISQLTFESLIQFCLQARMLMYFNQLEDQKAMDEFGVSVTAIVVSIMLAISHALLECVFLYMEAQASKTSFVNYCIICFNGRFGWVPYNDFLIGTSQKMQEDQKLNHTMTKSMSLSMSVGDATGPAKVELDFQKIQSKLCCFQMQVDFTFTDTTIMALSKTLAAFPPLSDEKLMPVIKFGGTINQISLENLVNLLKVCQGRVIIDLKGVDILTIFKNSQYSALVLNKNASTLSNLDRKYVFFLQESNLFQLLRFVLVNNEEILKVTKPDVDTNQDETKLIWIAYNKRDHKLLDLLLSLESDILKTQMAEVKDRSCLTLRFIDTMDFDIWQTLTVNTTVFDNHQGSFYFQAFMDHQTQDPAFFNKSLKWWHSRFGPSMPQEIVTDVKRWSSAYDFMQDSRKLYPQKIFFRCGKEYIEVDCKTAFCFAAIRKKLVRAWEISSTGPTIDKDSSEGTVNNPLDISDLQIPLSDFKILNMLLSDELHTQVKNLTAQKVKSLDYWAVKLKLDIQRWMYVGRSRFGDETGNQIQVIFYGKDTYCTNYGDRNDKPENKLKNGSNAKTNKLPYNQMTFYDSVEIELPETMNWITYHETTIALPPDNTVVSNFIFQKDTNFLGYLFSYGSQQKTTYDSDAVSMSQFDENQRANEMSSSKGFYQLDAFTPGTKVLYCPHPLHHKDTTCQKLRITIHIDFPYDVDIAKEQEKLETQAQRLRKEYTESIQTYEDAYQNARHR